MKFANDLNLHAIVGRLQAEAQRERFCATMAARDLLPTYPCMVCGFLTADNQLHMPSEVCVFCEPTTDGANARIAKK